MLEEWVQLGLVLAEELELRLGLPYYLVGAPEEQACRLVHALPLRERHPSSDRAYERVWL